MPAQRSDLSDRRHARSRSRTPVPRDPGREPSTADGAHSPETSNNDANLTVPTDFESLAPTSSHLPVPVAAFAADGAFIDNNNANFNIAYGHGPIANNNPNINVLSSTGVTVNYSSTSNFNTSTPTTSVRCTRVSIGLETHEYSLRITKKFRPKLRQVG